MSDDKTSDRGPDRIEMRVNEIATWLMKNHPEVFREQKHLGKETSERAYYMFGYMMALKDVIEVLKRMNIQWELD
jgi:hypothetical protein